MYSQRDSVHGCGMAARYSLNNITEMTRVAVGFFFILFLFRLNLLERPGEKVNSIDFTHHPKTLLEAAGRQPLSIDRISLSTTVICNTKSNVSD